MNIITVYVHSINAKKLNFTMHLISIALAPQFTLTNTFNASLMEEYPQRDVIPSELGTCVFNIGGKTPNYSQ